MTAPNGYAEIVQAFGDPRFDGNTVDPTWEAAHMVIVRDLPMVPKLYCHREIVEPLRQALAGCLALTDGYQLRRIGCFAPRAMRGSSHVSTHTWGIAVDLNPDTNGLISPCPIGDARRARPYYDLPDGWIAAFKAAGFMWGGDFKARFDPMHFQFCTGY